MANVITCESGVNSLIASVIIQAVRDYRKPSVINGNKHYRESEKERIKSSAKIFLESKHCAFMCEALGVNYNQITKELNLGG